ncbi:hypothetical protein [Rhodopseudomonas sp. B29]|uniref:hypothetical protein n=1 Tax=Rhodopseudomonas sp. B29 TaxID=95607 RepID=UPI0011D1A9DC|nr:hypothetical protein [Rhodopseudomonas sp. B29]
MAENKNVGPVDELDADRRKFLAACGKFAVVTPPVLTVLLSTSLSSEAVAQSGGGRGGRPIGRRDGRDFLEWLERLLDKYF